MHLLLLLVLIQVLIDVVVRFLFGERKLGAKWELPLKPIDLRDV